MIYFNFTLTIFSVGKFWFYTMLYLSIRASTSLWIWSKWCVQLFYILNLFNKLMLWFFLKSKLLKFKHYSKCYNGWEQQWQGRAKGKARGQSQLVHKWWGQTRVGAMASVRYTLQKVSLRAWGLRLLQEVLDQVWGYQLQGLPRDWAQKMAIKTKIMDIITY